MSDTLILTFQSQLSSVMETILKSAMYEISRLVEDSFLEEVGRSRQEVELLLKRLELSERKLKERERETCKRVRCMDCGRTGLSGEERNHHPSVAHTVLEKKQDAMRERWRNCDGISMCADLEATMSSLHRELESAGVEITKEGGGVKGEIVETRETLPYTAASHTHTEEEYQEQKYHPAESDHKHAKEQDKQDESMDRTHLRLFVPTDKTDCSNQPPFFCLPEREDVLQTSESLVAMQLTSSLELIPIKPEKVEEGEMSDTMITHSQEGQTRLEIQAGEFHSSRPELEEGMAFPEYEVRVQNPVRKHTKVVAHAWTMSSNPDTVGDMPGVTSLYKTPTILPKKKRKPWRGGLSGLRRTVDKPYFCSICGNRFSRLWNLKLHRRIHTQEKPHCCPMCDKSFMRTDILRVHLRTHTGERPYSCTLCGLSFKQLAHLRSHQRKLGHELKS